MVNYYILGFSDEDAPAVRILNQQPRTFSFPSVRISERSAAKHSPVEYLIQFHRNYQTLKIFFRSSPS